METKIDLTYEEKWEALDEYQEFTEGRFNRMCNTENRPFNIMCQYMAHNVFKWIVEELPLIVSDFLKNPYEPDYPKGFFTKEFQKRERETARIINHKGAY